MGQFLGPSGGVAPGVREPYGPTIGPGHAPGYNPWSSFNPGDINQCYPIPSWVAERIRDYPQTSEGNALRDPLPVPFTADEVRKALMDVWGASHQNNNRWCANVPAASVQIAMQVMPILRARNGGWIDFSGRAYNPLVNTPGSNRGRGSNLQCLLYKLPGKPLSATYNPCNATPARPSRTYSIRDVATTFDSSDVVQADQYPGGAPWSSTPFPYQPSRPLIGSDFEADDLEAPAEPPGLPLFDLVASFEAHE